jgi:hypothetical protein
VKRTNFQQYARTFRHNCGLTLRYPLDEEVLCADLNSLYDHHNLMSIDEERHPELIQHILIDYFLDREIETVNSCLKNSIKDKSRLLKRLRQEEDNP